jgi:hypothetical protein
VNSCTTHHAESCISNTGSHANPGPTASFAPAIEQQGGGRWPTIVS